MLFGATSPSLFKSRPVSPKIHRPRRGFRPNHLNLKTVSKSHMTTVASIYRSRGSSHFISDHSLLRPYAPAFDRQVPTCVRNSQSLIRAPKIVKASWFQTFNHQG